MLLSGRVPLSPIPRTRKRRGQAGEGKGEKRREKDKRVLFFQTPDSHSAQPDKKTERTADS